MLRGEGKSNSVSQKSVLRRGDDGRTAPGEKLYDINGRAARPLQQPFHDRVLPCHLRQADSCSAWLSPFHRAWPRHRRWGLEVEEPVLPPSGSWHLASEEAGRDAGARLEVGPAAEVVPPRVVTLVGAYGEEGAKSAQRGLDAGVLAEQHKGGHVAPRVGREAEVPKNRHVELMERNPHAGLERVGVDADGVRALRRRTAGHPATVETDRNVVSRDLVLFAECLERGMAGEPRRRPLRLGPREGGDGSGSGSVVVVEELRRGGGVEFRDRQRAELHDGGGCGHWRRPGSNKTGLEGTGYVEKMNRNEMVRMASGWPLA